LFINSKWLFYVNVLNFRFLFLYHRFL
jgi:hypothetical protein